MQALKYHKYFLKSTPYGQLQTAISNLQKVSQFDINHEQIQQTLKQFNQQHLSLVKINEENPVKYLYLYDIFIQLNKYYPIFSQCSIGDNKYIDQYNKKIYKINQHTLQIVNVEEMTEELPQKIRQLLNVLSPKIQSYVNKYFRQTFGAQVFIQSTQQSLKKSTIHIAFTSKNLQLANYLTGQWTSIYKLHNGKLSGQITINSHIFESGNVQMSQQRELKKQIQFNENVQNYVKEIIKVIERFQAQTQSGLSGVYEEMSSGFFKNLRRIAPITKTKMVWNVNSLKMNKNLMKGKN